jgi:hypothetical protein
MAEKQIFIESDYFTLYFKQHLEEVLCHGSWPSKKKPCLLATCELSWRFSASTEGNLSICTKYVSQNFYVLKERTGNRTYLWGLMACAVLSEMNVSIFCIVSKLRRNPLKAICELMCWHLCIYYKMCWKCLHSFSHVTNQCWKCCHVFKFYKM